MKKRMKILSVGGCHAEQKPIKLKPIKLKPVNLSRVEPWMYFVALAVAFGMVSVTVLAWEVNTGRDWTENLIWNQKTAAVEQNSDAELLGDTLADNGEPLVDNDEPDVVAMNEMLVLAMGIDAVISSVPEGGYASDITMVMIGNVIVNRTNDSRYPSTIEGVLTQPQQFSCFSSTGMKWVGKAANDEEFKQRCLDAAERVLGGEQLLSHSVVNVSSTKQGVVEAQLDGLKFCR